MPYLAVRHEALSENLRLPIDRPKPNDAKSQCCSKVFRSLLCRQKLVRSYSSCPQLPYVPLALRSFRSTILESRNGELTFEESNSFAREQTPSTHLCTGRTRCKIAAAGRENLPCSCCRLALDCFPLRLEPTASSPLPLAFSATAV